MPPPVFELRL